MDNPQFIYGTAWKDEDTERCVVDAIRAGFRAFDAANQRKHYYESGMGRGLLSAINLGLVSRRDLFIQTKFTFISGQDHRLPYDAKARVYDQVMQSFENSLEHLDAEYLDSYVLHGPSTPAGLNQSDWNAWQAIEDLHTSGKAKRIGVSNFNLDQLQSLWQEGRVKPHYVQNRCFASTGWDREVREFCLNRNIVYQGFSLLTANGHIVRNPAFQGLIEKYGYTPAQLVFIFAIAVGMVPLTGTTKAEHMKEDLEALSLKISPEDIKILENLG